MAERTLAERTIKRRRRRRRRRRYGHAGHRVLPMLFAVTLSVALLFLLRSDVFVVTSVDVMGTVSVPPDEIRREGGLEGHFLIWQVWPRRVEDRLVSHPRIKTADVSIAWINRVRVVVEERLPVVYLTAGDGDFVEVDEEGQVLSVRRDVPLAEEPLATGITGGSVRPGETLRRPEALRAVAVARALKGDGRDMVSEIHVADSGEVILYTIEGIPVYLGVEEDWDPKVDAFKGMIRQVDRVRVEYMDLRSARRPVVKLRQER